MKVIRCILSVILMTGFLSSCKSESKSEDMTYKSPDWFKKAVLYEIFIRSFRDSNGDGIGDLNGITQSLEYLQSLGVTALWLTPIFASPSYHGYDVSNYYAIQPEYGTKDDLIELINQVHKRGMYIILDYVASHTSNKHPFFVDALNNPQSEYADFYLWKDEAHQTYRSYMDYPNMPAVNHGSEKANIFFLDVAKYWLDPDQDGDFSDGIDGWRCDYAIGTPEAFWRSMRSELKELNPNVLLLGEVWVKEPAGQTGYFKDAFDAQFDFPLYFVLEGDPAISRDGLIAGKSLVSLATQRIEAGRSLFDTESLLVRFINNHDMDRSASEADGDPQRERLGALLVACLDGVPMIYYGEEIGMLGKRGSGPYFDEYRREPMEWNTVNNTAGTAYWFKEHLYIQDSDGISVAEQDNNPDSLLNYYRTIYKIRRENPALLTGKYQQMGISPANSQVWAFWRYTEDQITGIFFNFGSTEAIIQPDWQNAPEKTIGEPIELFHTGVYTQDAGTIQLAPASAVIFEFTK